MQLPKLQNYIDGAWSPVEESAVPLLNPSDGSLLGYQARSKESELERALNAAAACSEEERWYSYGAERGSKLLELAARLQDESEELAQLESLNTGVSLRTTRFLLSLLPAIFRGAAAELERSPDRQLISSEGRIELQYKPWGPALCLGPWNSPAPIGAHKLASALAAGAPVIFKPSEWTPYSTQRVWEHIAALDFPRGAVQLIHGTAEEGAFVSNDTRIAAISFTGGLRGGQAIALAAHRRLLPLQLELGGHNPFVILPDADLTELVPALMQGLTNLNGQWCRAVGQIWVPSALKAELIERFLELRSRLQVGAANDPHTELGPLIHRAHKQSLLNMLTDAQAAGAQVIGAFDAREEDSAYLLPRLITQLPASYPELEMFGPLASLYSYDQEEQLLSALRRNPYGLAAYVFGKDEAKAFHLAGKIKAGSIKVNQVSITSLYPSAPRVAWGLSGLGEEGSRETFQFFRGTSVIGRSR